LKRRSPSAVAAEEKEKKGTASGPPGGFPELYSTAEEKTIQDASSLFFHFK